MKTENEQQEPEWVRATYDFNRLKELMDIMDDVGVVLRMAGFGELARKMLRARNRMMFYDAKVVELGDDT